MSCTSDHLSADHFVEIIREFTDARGARHHIGESGILRRLDLDWSRQEIKIEWERDSGREVLFFSLTAKDGPRNGQMREFFALGERVPVAWPIPSVTKPSAAAAWSSPERPSRSQPHARAVAINQPGGKHPAAEVCLGEVRVACDCDPALHRTVLVEPRSISVTVSLRCATVTCTKCIGDDGRYHGNASHAYWTVGVPQQVVDWLAIWPRVKMTFADGRWPTASELIRRDFLYYPADTRCQSAVELAELEARLNRQQAGKTSGQCLRDFDWPQMPPPAGMPEALNGYVDVWETLHLRADSDLEKLICKAQLLSRANRLAVDLLWERSDAFDVMVRALRSNDKVWQSAGHAMAQVSRPGDIRLASAIIEILNGLSLAPLPEVPGRVVSCERFEALLMLVAELKLATLEMFAALGALQRRLARHDTWLVKYISIVLQELKGEPPLPKSSSTDREGDRLP